MKIDLDTVYEEQDAHLNYMAPTANPLKNVQLDDFTGSLFCPVDYYYYVIDFPSRRFDTVSHHVKDLFGIDPFEFTLETMMELCHPEDIDFMIQCEHTVADFIHHRIRPEQIVKYKINYCIRLKTKDGNYDLFLHQLQALSTGENGKLNKVFGIQSNISHITTVNNFKISFIGLQGETSFFEIDVFSEDMFANYPFINPFTKRELEILAFLGEGYTAGQIADFLHISEDTVKSHRKNMLNKAEQKNTTELVAHCIRKGFI